MKPPPKKVFITYSHKNAIQRESLEVALAVMVQNDEIKIWHDAKILPGDKWEKEIKVKLEESDILLYLVSPFSLASTNCNKEFEILGENSNIRIIPIILEDCDFLQHPLAEFEALPTKDKTILPISHWEKQSEAWQNIIEGIRRTLDKPSNKSTEEESDIPSPIQKKSSSDSITSKKVTAEFLFNRANFFLMLGNYDAAILFYTEALNLNPNDFLTYNNRGLAYFNKGEHEKAIADFNKAIELNPNNLLAYNNRGNLYQKEREFDKAIVDFSQAIKLKPNLPQVFFNRGAVYSMKEEYCLAIADFKKAIELDPKSVEAYSNRGLVYLNKGELELALIDLNKAIELNSDDAVPYNNRARVYFQKYEFDKAISDFNKAIKLNPNYAKAYNNRGIAKKILRDYKGAKQDFQTALKLAKQQGENFLATHIQKELTAISADPD